MTGIDGGMVAVAPPAATAGDVCRITIDTAAGRVDLAVPVDTPMAEVLPLVVRHVDPALTGSGATAAYVLQRLGERALDEDRTPAALGLRDGDVLYLRPSEDPLPPIDVDDVVDGVGAVIRDRPDAWHPGYTRRLLLGLTVMVLAGMLIGLLLPAPAGWRAGAAAGVALFLVAASGTSSRALGDGGIGVLLGIAAVPFAGLAGASVPFAAGADAWNGTQLMAAGAAATATATVVALAVAVARPLFVGMAVAAGYAVLAGVLIVAMRTSGVGAAVIVASLAYFTGVASPTVAVRVARLRPPRLPTTAEELQQDIDPIPEDLVRSRTVVADRYLSALFAAAGAAVVAALVALSTDAGWAPTSFVVVLSLALLLRARTLVNAWQRLATAVPGAVGLLLLALALAARADASARSALLTVGAVCVGAIVAVVHHLPPHRSSPWWGRSADVLETLAAIAIAPLALAVLGVYARVRGLGG
ncbi:type VII secretion integral membrane protein EccD [Salinispora arenicola]|uniref:type VII secretion integral membrane protein EccD n=1 Tax=Salinispora arenicola TaxID=168697 RepID=UPI00048AC3B9|nr:type VII secretion integral membrane protein EccD [Salinispora arenicola]NIL55650.1 type VII secretion integral membrane protein EccD [Salinispora arenicola]NIL64025.1 type VII secretion integral membrane protein EccD [Salinispora arenicola]